MFKATMIAGLGGFFGTALRFLSEKFGALLCAGAFPLGTFIANMTGCLLIGIFYGWATKTNILSKNMNIFLITGLCGGFTTFSSFSDDMIQLLEKGDDITFWLYMIGSLVFGIAMVALGIAAVRDKKATAQA